MMDAATDSAVPVVSETTKVVLPLLPRAPELLNANAPEKKLYWDRSHYDSPESQMRALAKSKTLYVGNLSFSTRSQHVRALFSELGPVKAVHMGLDRFRKIPCGFCFVEYARREDALLAVANISGTKLNGKVIRVELDAGFQPGRQYGRGVTGGQVRDERRTKVDPARSGGARLKWTPPNDKSEDSNHYGPSVGDKRGREEDDDEEMSAKNSRFRGES
jgi:nuclear cap-binding protein subunit 2